MKVLPEDQWLTATDIAAWKKWSRQTAWRWLCELERKHGAAVVERRGKTRCTTIGNLRRIGEPVPSVRDEHFERRIADLEERAKQADQRADAIAKEFLEFRRKAHEWFKLSK